MNKQRTPRDRGSVLPLVLVFMVVLSVVGLAIATYTATALRTSAVTTDIVDRLAAAESGMQAELEQVDNGTCNASTNRGPINGASVTTTCELASRVENADGGYALVVTGVGVDSNTEFTTLGPARKCIGGPIYFEAGVSVSLNNTAAVSGSDCPEGLAQPGEVRYNVAGGCPPLPPPGPGQGSWLAPAPAYGCDSRGWQATAPVPDLSAAPRTSLTNLAAPGGTAACRTYSPGFQVGGTLDLTDPSFFSSGVYYFENVTINIDDTVTFGKRTDGIYGSDYVWSASDTYEAACDTPSIYGADPGTGVVIVLGGASTISVNNGGRLGVYPRNLPVGTGTGDVAVLSFPVATLGYAPSSLDPDTTQLIDRHNGSNRSASFYGLTYAPLSWVDTGNASANAYIQFLGGLAVARAELRTEPPVGAFSIFVPSTLVKYYLLQSEATINGVVTKVRVVAKADDLGAIEVLTWRACAPDGCN